ncbi:MAG: L-threonylcarbamoyladenylate synthase [Bacteroidota bacterium]
MLLSVQSGNPEPGKLKIITECLLDGGVIIYPTDTIYSIGCSLTKLRGIERVARIKEIKPEKANFSIVCHDLSHLSDYAKNISTQVYKMMKKALPGPYTFILNASGNVPRYFNSNKKEVGIRIPDNTICREIIKSLGHPLIATSVHDDDEVIEYSTDPRLIHDRYEKLVDMVIDGGYGNNIASTVIDCTGDEPEVIREGAGEVGHLL